MKKILCLFTAIIFTISSCSSDNSDDDFLDNGDPMKFKIEGGLEFSSRIPNSNNAYGSAISKYLNNNGTIKYEIFSSPNRVGDNPLFQQDGIYFGMNFTLNDEIFVGQIIDISDIELYMPIFPYLTTGNYDQTYFVNQCESIKLSKQSSSTGFIKITKITELYVYGEFEFKNLLNTGGKIPNTTQPCPNYPTQTNYNIVNGSFKAI